MIKTFFTLLIFIGVSFGYGQQPYIRVYNWTNYMDPALLDKFTQQTGIQVIYKTYDNNDALIKELSSSRTIYDVIFPTAHYVSELANAQLIQSIDKRKIPNIWHSWSILDKKIAQIPNVNEYSINWMWGNVGIAYNPKLVSARAVDVQSLEVIFNPMMIAQLADCGVYLVDEADDIFALALRYLNIDPYSKASEDLQAAYQLISHIMPYVKISSTKQIDALAMGSACLSVGYSGDIFMAQAKAQRLSNGIQIQYIIPKSYEIIWADQMAIPSNAQNPEGAHAFINFLMDPTNNAQAQQYLNYASGNKTSHLLMDTKHLSNPLIYMKEEMINNAYMAQPQNPTQRKNLTQMWDNLKKLTLE